MNVEIIERAAIRAHAVAHEGAVAAIPETWARLWRWHEQAGLAGSPLYPIGVCYDDPEAECGFRYYAGLVFPAGVEGAGGLRILDIPGGRYAFYRHVGPYSDIAGAFRNLYGAWLPSSGHESDDRPALEIYRNTPCDTPAERLATDLLVPVRQRRR
jgi:AraC family transcriptional regulator